MVAPASVPAKKAKKRAPKKSQKKKHSLPLPSESITLSFQIFNILPASAFSPRIAHILSFLPSSMKEQNLFIAGWVKPPFKSKFPITYQETSWWNPCIAPDLRKAVPKIRKARCLFKILLHHWRVRRMTPMNTIDLLTGEPPRHPIAILDWKTRSKYMFEASTLAKDIRERLLCHDGLWAEPQAPRNPFTNIPLTLPQLISVFQQLDHAPTPQAWALGAFRQARYDMKQFNLIYDSPLTLYAFRTTMNSLDHFDARERLLDFIEYVYDQQDAECPVTTYSYMMLNFPTNPILQLWFKLCYEFYETPLLYRGNPNEVQIIQTNIVIQTRPLLLRFEELRMLRLTHLRTYRALPTA